MVTLSSLRGIIRWIAFSGAIAIVASGAVAGYAFWRFGDSQLAIQYLRGEKVLLSPEVITVTDDASSNQEWKCVIWNLQAQPLKVLGANASCSCISIAGCPATIGSGESHAFVISAREIRSNVAYRVVFFADDSISPHLIMVIRKETLTHGKTNVAGTSKHDQPSSPRRVKTTSFSNNNIRSYLAFLFCFFTLKETSDETSCIQL